MIYSSTDLSDTTTWIIIAAIFLISYILMVIPVYILAKMRDDISTGQAILSFIPILNIFPTGVIVFGRDKWWWSLITIIPFIGFFASLYMNYRLIRNLGYNAVLAIIGVLTGIVEIVMLWISALDGKGKTRKIVNQI